MSNSARKAKPKVDLGPDYVLQRIMDGLFYGGMFCSDPMWCDLYVDAALMKGPGLASAERALKRRGYIVERVRVEE